MWLKIQTKIIKLTNWLITLYQSAYVEILQKMSNVQVCQFDDNLVEELKKFRFSRSTADRAIVMKIDTSKMMLVIDEHYEDTTTDELR